MQLAGKNPEHLITALLKHRRLLLLACFLRLKDYPLYQPGKRKEVKP